MSKYEELIDCLNTLNYEYGLTGYDVLLLADTLEKLDNEYDIEISDDVFDEVRNNVLYSTYSTDEFIEEVYDIIEESITNIEND